MTKKALSIRQPWADLIINGKKNIEIRKWKTSYRGEIYIHTGKQMDAEGLALFEYSKDLPTGVIIGKCDLVDVVTYNSQADFEKDKDKHLNPIDWFDKKIYGFIFKNCQKLEIPIKLKGQLNIFDFQESVPMFFHMN